MSIKLLEAQRRDLRLYYGVKLPTTAATTGQSPEVPIWFDDRLTESEATNTLEQGYTLLNRAVWLPVDTFAGSADGPTVAINRRVPPGVGTAPASAATAALGGVSGNGTLGTHKFTYTYVVNGVETPIATASNTLTFVAGNNTANLTGMTVGPTGTTARRVYYSLAGTTTPFYLAGEILDNTTTTFTFNIADGTNNTSRQLLVPAPGQSIAVATYTFGTNNNAVAYLPVTLTLTANAERLYLATGDALTFAITQNGAGTALAGGFVYVDLHRR